MPTHLTALQERILLELSGQGRAVSLHDLCDVIGADPSDCKKAGADLWLADMIERQYSYRDGPENPRYSITWIGERWLADRPKPSMKDEPDIGHPPWWRLFGFGLRGRIQK
jgi:hypothetical protein